MAAKNKCLNKFAQLKYLYYLYKKLRVMKKFEYLVKTSISREEIDSYGLEGWELVLTYMESRVREFVFKREIL